MPIKTLGSVVHITPSKLIIVRISDPEHIPSLNAEVVDAQGETIGVVVDIIGPLTEPYAVVKPLRLALLSFVKPSMVLFYRYTVKRSKKLKRR